MTAVFVRNGVAFGAWAASIPRVREASGLTDGAPGVSPEPGLAIPGAAVALCGLAALARPEAPYDPPTRTRWTWPSPAIAVLAGLVSLSFAIEGGVSDWSRVYFSTGLGASAGAASSSIAVYAAAMVVMRLVGDALVRRLGPVRVVAGGGAVAGVGLAVPGRRC